MLMDIASFSYLLFISISLLIYWKISYKFQWYVLLADSLIFYFLSATAFTFAYVFITSISVWLATIYFSQRRNSKKSKKIILVLTISINIGILAILKYTNLGIHTINIISKLMHSECYLKDIHLLAPLAISFYSLQAISYLLDCYWGLVESDKNFFRVLLFIIFFPQMVSGPISKYSSLSIQLFEEHRFNYEKVTHGLKRIALGFLKKLAVSNRIAVIVDYMWNDPNNYHGLFIWLMTALYVLQLYTDFSGCMDIVIGTSECFGINVEENFMAPLLSKTIQEFWQRWHITLGHWLRDYIMYPLLRTYWLINFGKMSKTIFGKKQGQKIPTYVAMFFLWSAMGLWHGNSWKYIIGQGWWFWSMIVIGQIFAYHFQQCKKLLHITDNNLFFNLLRIIRTNLIFIWGTLFFRAESFRDATWRIAHSFNIPPNFFEKTSTVYRETAPDFGGKVGMILCLVSLLFIIYYDIYLYKGIDFWKKIESRKYRYLAYYYVVFTIIFSLNIGRQEFLYAQF